MNRVWRLLPAGIVVLALLVYSIVTPTLLVPSRSDREHAADPTVSAEPTFPDAYVNAIGNPLAVTVRKDPTQGVFSVFRDTRLVVSVQMSFVIPSAEADKDLTWRLRLPSSATAIRAMDANSVSDVAAESTLQPEGEWTDVEGGSWIDVPPAIVGLIDDASGAEFPYSAGMFIVEIRVDTLGVAAVREDEAEATLNHLKWTKPAPWGMKWTFAGPEAESDILAPELLSQPFDMPVARGAWYQLSVCRSCDVMTTYGVEEYDPGSARKGGRVHVDRVISWTSPNRPSSWLFSQTSAVIAAVISVVLTGAIAFALLWYRMFGRPQAAGRRKS